VIGDVVHVCFVYMIFTVTAAVDEVINGFVVA